MPKIPLIFLLMITLFIDNKGYSQNKKPLTPVQKLFLNVEKVVPNYKKYCKPGYTKEQLIQFEKELGYLLPDAVKEFYLKTKGDDLIGLAYGWTFFPIIEGYHFRNIFYESSFFIDNPHQIKQSWNKNKRIPIIEDGGGSVIYLDYDPNSLGTYGQLILVFRDYPEIIFSVSKDFESFIVMLNEKFNRQEMMGYIGDEESKYAHVVIEMKNGGSDYSNWVSMSHDLGSKIKDKSNEILKIDSIWHKTLKESRNYEFIGRGEDSLKKSNTDRVYYLLLRDENLKNLEPLTLFPNLTKITFYLRYNKIPPKLWEILEKTRITDIDFITSYDSIITLDFKNFTKLQSLSNLNLQAGYVPNIDSVSYFSNLKNLRTNQISDLRFLSKIPNLISLNLEKEGKEYQNWDAISTLKELKYLDIPTSNFSDLNVLTNLKKLMSLKVSNNHFMDYTLFEKLPSRLWLSCSYDCFEKIFDIAVRNKFTISPIQYAEPTPKQKELYEKYRQIRENWKYDF